MAQLSRARLRHTIHAAHYFSGNSPGIHRAASFAGNANFNDARVVSAVTTRASIKAEVTRRA